jgi:diguanylate cyclase (GGDEF)-like protein/PAS domain S-box-containing protein
MGRPEITDQQLEQGIHVGLPLKITGIAFWGLVVVGLVLVAEAMHWLQRDTEITRITTAQNATLMTQALLARNEPLSNDELQDRLGSIIASTGIVGISIVRGLDTLQSGATGDDLFEYVGTFPTHDAEGAPLDIHTSVWLASIDSVMAPEKKRLLIEMGILVFLFGTILQRILHKLLTGPITRMVVAAQDCSQGKTARFDEERRDEFGYLARFINRALDTLTQRQNEVVAALERASISESALSDEKERAEVTLHSIAEGVITTNSNGLIQYLNPVAEALTGFDQTAAMGQSIETIMRLENEHSGLALASSVTACLRSNSVTRALTARLLVRRNGEKIAIEETAAPIRDPAGNTIGTVLVFADVSATRELTRQLSYQASHDTLTGLFNRHEFEKRLRDALVKAADGRNNIILCYMDLDQFKLVNDTCGHIAGDELLRQLARRLLQELRDTDTIARLGGDEFGVLLEGCSPETAERVSSKLCKAVRDHHFVWDGKTFQVGVSIGVVPLSADTRDVAEALSSADVACYAAKDSGRDRVHIYEADDDDLQRRRTNMHWVSRIRQALLENRFKLYHQPIVAIDANPGIACHHEVLLRMLDEEGQLLAPGQFLGAAEQFGLMLEIDQWVLTHALDWLADSGGPHGHHNLAINLSGQSLSSQIFLDDVMRRFSASPVNPAHICFEITETAAIADLENATRFIAALGSKGCKFALDDFGSGMSSFAYLKNLRVDYLKIDGSYVKDLVSDPIDRAMVEAVNQIGHAMGMKTIAEFVENQATLQALAAIGVDYAQGYGIAKPAPLETLSSNNILPLRKA